jgi:TetR/AcrR family transcriptional regulator, regulator of cefoperazone and chloramphenicol sensitivity
MAVAVSADRQIRDRLLDSAETLFAARGFRATSIRRITAEAGCNIASVNYYFGGKTRLYREMLRRRLRVMRQQRIGGIRTALRDAGRSATLDLVLIAFTTAFLEPHLDESRGRQLVRLLWRELVDPHLRPGTLRREMLEPLQAELARSIRSVCPGVEARALRRSVHSIIAQLAHVVQMRRLDEGGARGDFAFPGIVDHIIRFSAAGIRACRS